MMIVILLIKPDRVIAVLANTTCGPQISPSVHHWASRAYMGRFNDIQTGLILLVRIVILIFYRVIISVLAFKIVALTHH